MTPSPRCFALIRTSECLRTKAYLCPAGKLTIGYGHTGPDVKDGEVIDEGEAEALLKSDVTKAAQAVAQLAPICTQGQFDALTDFVFNLGAQHLASSTLLHRHNAGDYAGASAEFGKWVYGGGKVLPGLVKRRACEAHMYVDGTLP